jgi:predicted RNA-binding protein with RPS1 domain
MFLLALTDDEGIAGQALRDHGLSRTSLQSALDSLRVEESFTSKGKEPMAPIVGKTYRGTVTRILDFGAMVEIMPGREGVLHITQIADEKVYQVSDYLKEGQVVKVKVIEADEKGRVRLSMRAVAENSDGEGATQCPACGFEIESGALFCSNCGAALRSATIDEKREQVDETGDSVIVVLPDASSVRAGAEVPAMPSTRIETRAELAYVGSDAMAARDAASQRLASTLQAVVERRASSESQAPDDLGGLKVDRWLLECCRGLTARIFSDIVGPWNSDIAAAQDAYSASQKSLTQNHKSAYAAADGSVATVEKEIDLEKRADAAKLQDVQGRFSGLPADLFVPALHADGRRIQGGRDRGQDFSSDGQRLLANIEASLAGVNAIGRVQGTEWQLFKKGLTGYGGYIFGGCLVLLWILVSFNFAFLVSCAVSVAVPYLRARSAWSDAHSACASLVGAIGQRHAWLDTVRLQRVKAEAQETREKADRVLAAGRLEADKILTERLEAVLKKVEPIAREAREALERLHSVGGYKTAATTESASWESWECAMNHAGVVRLGQTFIFAGPFPSSNRELIKESAVVPGFVVPVLASLRNGRSMYVAIKEHAQIPQAYGVARNAIFRILATAPPAKVLFTFIDPIGQGQNVASFLALADFDESLVNVQAWTDPRQIERKLTDLTEHMETVIQKYLRSDYSTIDDYNDAAGEIAEAYRVVVIFDFPECITETAARQLERIVQNGGRCGVYAIVIHDVSKNPSYGVNAAAITKHSLAFYEEGGKFHWDNYGHGKHAESVMLTLDGAPPEELTRRVLKEVGEAAKTALKVEVPYAKLLQLAGIGAGHIWDQSTVDGLRIPLGPGSARKPRLLELGVGLSVHALVIGRPGSGKSNLMHVVISTAARMYSPSELQLYLIDFKEGVEFKPYAEAGLPHARVIAIRSEREFGLSVLRALDAELKRRSDAFRRAGVQDFRQYRALRDEGGNALKLPRILLLIDEFQEFFVKQDTISDEVALLLDRIVRQGRAFGMHMLLGSQTLSGYSLPRATLNLITVRIALQSSEADSRMILADDNTAARRLSRPGEGIYNASSGLVEGNNLFQVALFDDTDRKAVLDVVEGRLAQARTNDAALPAESFGSPLVFEGHEPAVLSQSAPLHELLSRREQSEQRRAFEVWLGEPIEIKPPTSFIVSRRAGSHLLVVSKNEEEAVGVLCAAMLGLILQNRPGKIEIPIVDLTTADAPWADLPEHIESLFPLHGIKVHDRRSLPRILQRLSDLIRERIDETGTPETTHFLLLLGMHRARDLRQQESISRLSLDDDAKPDLSAQLSNILRDGPECGVHVLAWCDSAGNLEKALDRRVIGEFGTRVVGQMNSNDLRTLVEDEAAATRLERPHRLVKYEEEHVGVLETFRPYGLPDRKWLEEIAATHGRNQ